MQTTEETQMPVVISCGAWGEGGWLLQQLGGRWRWYVGGINCDGGKLIPERWTHIVASYDGEKARLYQDGAPVAETFGLLNGQPWEKPLHIGQYSASPNESYQFKGYLSGVKIYNRILSAEDARNESRKRPGTARARVTTALASKGASFSKLHVSLPEAQ